MYTFIEYNTLYFIMTKCFIEYRNFSKKNVRNRHKIIFFIVSTFVCVFVNTTGS